MSQINPLMGSIVQAPVAQRIAETEKSRQMRKADDLRKNSAARDDEEVDESVASPDELQGAGDDHPARDQRKGTYSRRKPRDPEPQTEGDGLDLTA